MTGIDQLDADDVEERAITAELRAF